MGVSEASYVRMLGNLLPPGRLWRWLFDTPGIFRSVLEGCAVELARVDADAESLTNEIDVKKVDFTLEDRERVLGLLPFDFLADGSTVPVSVSDRKARVIAKTATVVQSSDRTAIRAALAPILDQDPGDITIIELSAADAELTGRPEEVYRFFVLRPISPAWAMDIVGAQKILDDVAQSHTQGHVIETTDMICDDPHSLVDRDLLGG